jgi:hypothetical protein
MALLAPAATADPKPAARRTQGVLWCRLCGEQGKLVAGYCSRCYSRRHWDKRYFAGLRVQVLARDNHACQVCSKAARGKRSIAVHHRRPGTSTLASLISLCPGCHARLHKTLVWRQDLFRSIPYAVALWRELHPGAPEQLALRFDGPGFQPGPAGRQPCTLELALG